MREVDADHADRFTAVAFTKNFRGSPHIDTQNIGPFYGLALGDFRNVSDDEDEDGDEDEEGDDNNDDDSNDHNSGTERRQAKLSVNGGALCVESSPWEVTFVDTRGKMAKVDGRYPHWVESCVGG